MVASTDALTLAEVLQRPADLAGRPFTVTGLFAGWEGRCAGSPPRSRSDWMLVDAPHCIYVSGSVPDGIAPPPDIASNGRSVTLRVQLDTSDDGRLYLRRVP